MQHRVILLGWILFFGYTYSFSMKYEEAQKLGGIKRMVCNKIFEQLNESRSTFESRLIYQENMPPLSILLRSGKLKFQKGEGRIGFYIKDAYSQDLKEEAVVSIYIPHGDLVGHVVPCITEIFDSKIQGMPVCSHLQKELLVLAWIKLMCPSTVSLEQSLAQYISVPYENLHNTDGETAKKYVHICWSHLDSLVQETIQRLKLPQEVDTALRIYTQRRSKY